MGKYFGTIILKKESFRDLLAMAFVEFELSIMINWVGNLFSILFSTRDLVWRQMKKGHERSFNTFSLPCLCLVPCLCLPSTTSAPCYWSTGENKLPIFCALLNLFLCRCSYSSTLRQLRTLEFGNGNLAGI